MVDYKNIFQLKQNLKDLTNFLIDSEKNFAINAINEEEIEILVDEVKIIFNLNGTINFEEKDKEAKFKKLPKV
jgi:hypothetical protein